jgi:hypothetical protein
MEQTNQDKHEVRGVSMKVFVLPCGEVVPFPPEFDDVKMKKNGWPDKRGPRYAEFMAWATQMNDAKLLESKPLEAWSNVGAAVSFGIEGDDKPMKISGFPSGGGTPVVPGEVVQVFRDPFDVALSQSLATRIFNGQSPDLLMPDRLARVKAGLEEQGLSMEGVVLP